MYYLHSRVSAKNVETYALALTLKLIFFLAWSKNPTLTIIETMTHPIDKVTFPAVTICPKSSNPDRWGPVIKVFDYMKRRCPAVE